MALMDGYNRRFSYLRLSVTDVCNFRCDYCLPDGYSKTAPHDFLSLEEIKIVGEAMAGLGIKKIRITGGEPTLRKDIIAIIRTLKNIDGIKTVAMTSNGYKLEQDALAYADAGLDALNISIDSLDATRFKEITGHDKLTSILRGLSHATTAGIATIKINCVLMRRWTLQEVGAYLDFIKSNTVSARFIELMETGNNKAFFTRQHASPTGIISALEADGWQERVKSLTDGPARTFTHPAYAGSIGFITPYAKAFCSTCNRLRVSARGGLQLCLFGGEDYPLRPLIASGDQQALQSRIRDLVSLKDARHHLHQGQTGKTQHFASIGG